jgi:hydrogenase expression/formation protein HypC
MTDAYGACEVTDGCITCGDVAVPLTVVELVGSDAGSGSVGRDALCRDDEGRVETVALDFVTAAPGDRVLVHAGVALERLGALETKGSAR